MTMGAGVTGGDVTSGCCCQNKDLVPASPWPHPLVSELQPLGLAVTLALNDTLNLRQPGMQTHTDTHTAGEGVTVTCLLSPSLFCTTVHMEHIHPNTETQGAPQTCSQNVLADMYFIYYSRHQSKHQDKS